MTTAKARRERGALPLTSLTAMAPALWLGSAGTACAASSSSGSTTATFSVLVRSITVSPGTVPPGTVSLSNCSLAGTSTGTALSFPNGPCQSSSAAITVTNGPVAGHIDMAAWAPFNSHRQN
jgi:hypothetical protein